MVTLQSKHCSLCLVNIMLPLWLKYIFILNHGIVYFRCYQYRSLNTSKSVTKDHETLICIKFYINSGVAKVTN